MTGRPILTTPFERRLWRELNGGGFFGRFAATNGGHRTAVEALSAHEGTVSPGLLVSLIGRLEEEGAATPDALRTVLSRSRTVDCTPSVRAAEAMLAIGDPEAAAEMLSMSDSSGEVLHRSVAEARIRFAKGDREGAREAALRAYGVDPLCGDPYGILAETDPDGGWPQMLNLHRVHAGMAPENPPGEGRVQELYRIYQEWYLGSRESASAMLARSMNRHAGDPDFMLASARLSAEEGDWHSAMAMYGRLLPGAPPFITREAAEACLSSGDVQRALDLLRGCDQTSSRTMVGIIRARHAAGDARGTKVAFRVYLDSEWAGSEEYLEAAETLMSYGMDDAASDVLTAYTGSCGMDEASAILRSELSVRSGDGLSALMYANRAVAKGRGSAASRVQLARVRLSMGDSVKAEKECARVLSDAPRDAGALHLMMAIQSDRGDHAAAADTCRRILEDDPFDTAALISLTSSLVQCGDPRSASEAASRAVRADGSRATYVAVMEALMSAGTAGDAVYLCREAESRFPGDPAIAAMRGRMEHAAGEFAQACATFARALTGSPSDPSLWYSKGRADQAAGDMASAEAAYDRALAIDPGEPVYWMAKSEVREAAGDFGGAVRALDRASELDRRDVRPLVRKASILTSAGREADAMRVLEVAMVMDPSDPDVRDAMAAARREAGGGPVPDDGDVPEDIPEEAPEPVPGPAAAPAVPLPPEAPADDPREGDVAGVLADARSLAEVGDAKGALAAVDKALSIDPGSIPALSLKAGLCLRSGDNDGAAEAAGAVLEADQSDTAMLLLLGRAELGRGRFREASEVLDRAASLGMDDADLHAAKGQAAEGLGQMDRAAECYSAAVSRDPDRLDLAERLARIMYSRREAMAADGMLNRILRRDPRRMSAILLKAEIAHARRDDRALMAAYSYFIKCPNPGPDSVVRMVRLLEESGHAAEARELVVGRPEEGSPGDSVKAHAAEALRRAYSMKVQPTDPDMLRAMGLDAEAVAAVRSYLGAQPDHAPISPADESFARMEALSRDAVMKLGWRDLEHEPRLPLEAVFVRCGFEDPDDAKEVVGYVLRAMLSDPGRTSDPRLTDISMGLPRGVSVYEIMRDCGLGVHEARAVKGLVV